MLIISVEVMKTIDERERCEARCVVMKWSSSKSVIKTVKDADN